MRTRLGEAKWIGAAAAVAVVVGLSVGGAAALKLGSGGGAQPEDVMPANAMVFAKLDLNPSAGQKLAAYRLAAKFPGIKSKVTSEDTSIKEATFGAIFTGPTSKAGFGLDYKKDVEPWLGDRVGVGVFPDIDGDKQPEVGIAIAVTDEKAARVALDKAIVNAAKVGVDTNTPFSATLDPVKPTKTGYAFTDGFVVLSDTTAHADALVKAGKAGTLADSKYAGDVKELDSDQIAVAWVDIAAVYKAIPKGQLDPATLSMLKGPMDPKNASGRFVMGLHADPSFVEVTGKGIDLKGVDSPVKGAAGPMIASFPADVFGAASISGFGKELATVYTMFTKDDSLGVKSQLDRVGISSAKDIETLFGAETGVVVGGGKENPEVAVRTRGADADAALVIARRVMEATSVGSMGITAARVTGPDGIVVGRGASLTAAVSDKSGGKLGDTEAFKQVIPDADKVLSAEYVDLSKIIQMFAGDSKDAASLKPLKAIGVSSTGGSEPTFRIRVSVK